MKKLEFGLKQLNGRNSFGRITVFHRGGGHKRKYRMVNFFNNIQEVYGMVRSIKYDPNRSSFICLICYSNGILVYILCPLNLKLEDKIITTNKNNHYYLNIGNTLVLKNLYKGCLIHNLTIQPFKKKQLIRAAGVNGVVLNKFLLNYTVIKLPSGELRAFSLNNYATIGVISNEAHKHNKKRKAGQSRWLNIRPTVRGVAMNPIDHPHGGGEGKSSGGHPKTPWGFFTKGGYKTRSKKKINKLIIKRRLHYVN